MATTKPEVTASERGTYGKQGNGPSTGMKAAIIGIGAVGVLLTPVIAIVGGLALATAISGRGGKQ